MEVTLSYNNFRFNSNTPIQQSDMTALLETRTSTSHDHRHIQFLSSYRGVPFVTGSSGNTETEIYSEASGKWEGAAQYAFSTKK